MRSLSARDNQNIINLIVLLVSAACAWFAPLQTFLVAYAVIGPFHYLTEIAWLRKKSFYFSDGVVSPPVYLIVATVLCGVACMDLVLRRGWAAYAIGALLVLALGSLVKNVPVLFGALALLGVTRYFFHGYGLFLAVFVPTVVHVYFFTLIFLLSGAMRAGRTILGWLNAALLVAIPVLLVKFVGAGGTPGAYWMTSEATFAPLHQYIAGVLGLTLHFDPAQALQPGAIAVFRFLGFIYLHHYLNWFAKTELLEWHRVSRRSWVAIWMVYAAALGSYAYSFAAGFYAAYFLSLLHVLLELPLDWRTGVGLISVPWKAWRTSKDGQAVGSIPHPATTKPSRGWGTRL